MSAVAALGRNDLRRIQNAAYLAGYRAAGYGYDSDPAFPRHAPHTDPLWLGDRDAALTAANAAVFADVALTPPPPPTSVPLARDGSDWSDLARIAPGAAYADCMIAVRDRLDRQSGRFAGPLIACVAGILGLAIGFLLGRWSV